MPLTKRDLRYLFILAKALGFIGQALSKKDRNQAVLYHLVVAGECVAKHTPKISEDARKLLPKDVCSILQDIRDNYTAHGGNIAAISEKDLIMALSNDINSIKILEQIICDLLVREGIRLFTTKLTELVNIDKEKIAKTKDLIDVLVHIYKYLEIDILQMPPELREEWNLVLTNVKNLCKTLMDELKTTFNENKEKEARKNAIHTLKTSVAFTNRVAELMVLQGKVFAIKSPKFATAIPEFCYSTHHCCKFIKKEQSSRYSSMEVDKTKKEKTTKLLNECSDLLKECIEKLNSCEEGALASYKFGMDTEIGALVCTTRWYLIVIGALFDELELESDKKFKLPRNEAIHKFDEINCVEERDALKLILEQKLVPYGKITAKEGTPMLKPEPPKRKIEEDAAVVTEREKKRASEEKQKTRQDEPQQPPAPSYKPT